MSLPVSKEQFTFVIWSNEYLDWDNYRDAFEEDYSGLSDDEKYQLMCDLNSDYLDDDLYPEGEEDEPLDLNESSLNAELYRDADEPEEPVKKEIPLDDDASEEEFKNR